MTPCLIYVLQTRNTPHVMERFVMSMLGCDYQGIALCRVWGDVESWRGGWSRLGMRVSAGKYHVPKPRVKPILKVNDGQFDNGTKILFDDDIHYQLAFLLPITAL